MGGGGRQAGRQAGREGGEGGREGWRIQKPPRLEVELGVEQLAEPEAQLVPLAPEGLLCLLAESSRRSGRWGWGGAGVGLGWWRGVGLGFWGGFLGWVSGVGFWGGFLGWVSGVGFWGGFPRSGVGLVSQRKLDVAQDGRNRCQKQTRGRP